MTGPRPPFPIPTGPIHFHPMPVLPPQWMIAYVQWTFWSFQLVNQRSFSESKNQFLAEVIFGYPVLIVVPLNIGPPAAAPVTNLASPLDERFLVGVSAAQLSLYDCDGSDYYTQNALSGVVAGLPVQLVSNNNLSGTSVQVQNGTATLTSLGLSFAQLPGSSYLLQLNADPRRLNGAAVYFNNESACAGTWQFWNSWVQTVAFDAAVVPFSIANPPIPPAAFPPGGIFQK